MTGSDNPCATCSNRDCANSLLARWWDLCVESKFTLFKQIAPPPSGAIGTDAGEMDPNGDEGAES
jgi:hypothetical protein